jgi:hypothetical protein
MGSAGLTKTPMKMGSAKMTTMQKPKMKILKHFRLWQLLNQDTP